MRYFILIISVLLSFPGYTQQPKVHVKGAMMEIMHQGDITAKADLEELKDKEYLYALGARENLKGEILVWDGRPVISTVEDEELRIDTGFQHKATLLVYANIPEWMARTVPDSVRDMKELESYIGEWIEQSGFDSKKPIPFKLEGQVEELQWHVIDWPEGDTEHTHAKHRTSGLNGILEDRPVQMIGFFSTQHQGVFTHHDSNVHMHVRTTDGEIAGHVDDLRLGEPMYLFFPFSLEALEPIEKQ